MYRMDWRPRCLIWVFRFVSILFPSPSLYFLFFILFSFVSFLLFLYIWSSLSLSGLVADLFHSLYSAH